MTPGPLGFLPEQKVEWFGHLRLIFKGHLRSILIWNMSILSELDYMIPCSISHGRIKHSVSISDKETNLHLDMTDTTLMALWSILGHTHMVAVAQHVYSWTLTKKTGPNQPVEHRSVWYNLFGFVRGLPGKNYWISRWMTYLMEVHTHCWTEIKHPKCWLEDHSHLHGSLRIISTLSTSLANFDSKFTIHCQLKVSWKKTFCRKAGMAFRLPGNNPGLPVFPDSLYLECFPFNQKNWFEQLVCCLCDAWIQDVRVSSC